MLPPSNSPHLVAVSFDHRTDPLVLPPHPDRALQRQHLADLVHLKDIAQVDRNVHLKKEQKQKA